MSDAALIRDILTLGNQLKRSLKEFIALTEKNLDHLETVLQQRKVDLLKSIQAQWPQEISSEAAEASAERVDMSDPLWDEAAEHCSMNAKKHTFVTTCYSNASLR